jgi:hypothetical protein
MEENIEEYLNALDKAFAGLGIDILDLEED